MIFWKFSTLLAPIRAYLIFFVISLAYSFIISCSFITFMPFTLSIFYKQWPISATVWQFFGFSWPLLNHGDIILGFAYLRTIKFLKSLKFYNNSSLITTWSIIAIQQFFLPARLLEPAGVLKFHKKSFLLVY